MSEKHEKVDVVRVSYWCDEDCCDGEVLPTGEVDTSGVLEHLHLHLHLHICADCAMEYAFTGEPYPRVVLKVLEG